MKKLVITLILCFPFLGVAQDLSDWHIGINANPFIFNRIQESKILVKGKQNFPNGFGFGLTLEKNWNEHFGFKTGIEYCTQNQKYDFFYTSQFTGKTNIDATVAYYKIPIAFQYSYPISNKLYFLVNQGIQYSNVKDFNVIETEIGQFNVVQLRTDQVYNRHLFGIVGSIGLKQMIFDKFSYSANLRYEFDFTEADNNSIHINFIDSSFGTTPAQNFRIGLELGLQYHLTKFIRFNKNPK